MKPKSRKAIIGDGLNKGILAEARIKKNRIRQIGDGINKALVKKARKK